MGKYTHAFILFTAILFAFSSINYAQNTVKFKKQISGLKNIDTKQHPVLKLRQDTSSYIYLRQGFDGDFLPTGWNQNIVNANNTWSQLNPDINNFNEIDPLSLFSAMVPWASEYQDEWIITPEIIPTGEHPLSITYYAGVSGPWLTNATLKCHISIDGGNSWIEIWDAVNHINPSANWAWHLVSVDLSEYSDQAFTIAWQYIGNDGDLAGIDGVSIKAGLNYLFFDDMENYTSGIKLAAQANPDWWTTWSHNPGSYEDGLVTNEISNSPTQSCMISGSNDLLLKLGDKTTGAYIFSVMYYIPSGFGGYMNMQHFEIPALEWAYQVYFGANGDDQNGYIKAGSSNPLFFTFPHDTWIKLETMIDLDTDKAIFKIDDLPVIEWQFSLQSTGEPGTKQIGSVNFYAGAPPGDTPKYYFDDVAFMTYNQGLSDPVVVLDTSAINITLKSDEYTIITRNMSNQGETNLVYEIIPVYPDNPIISHIEPVGCPSILRLPNDNPVNPDYNSSSTNFSDRDIILHYDSDNLTAAGSPSDYEYSISSMFPHEMIRPYIGMQISSIEVYINDPVDEAKIQIYDMGTIYSAGPGELLLEQVFSPVAHSWNEINLNTPITITGRDIWVGWWMAAPGNNYSPGCDAGPANENGDWISTGAGWGHLSEDSDMNYNWNIRANLSGSPCIQWLNTIPFSGELSQNENIEIDINIDATGLFSNVYHGTVVIRTNDLLNNMMAIDVVLTITDGISEIGEQEYFAVYPNPASKILHVKSNVQINKMQLITAAGQVVFDNTTSEINVSHLDRGAYILKLNTKNGIFTKKILIQ